MQGVILVVVAASLGGLILRAAARYPRPRQRYRRLLASEAAIVDAAAETFFPPGGQIQSSGADADAPAYLDRLLDVSQPRIRTLVRLLFFAVEHATLVFPAPGRGGFRRFTKLSAEQRMAVLDAFASSGLFARRLLFVSLRSLLTMAYLHHPPVQRDLGIEPWEIDTPVCEADLFYPPIGGLPGDIRFTRDDVTAPTDRGTPLDRAAGKSS
ncbi:MAG: hypothetical protein HRU01_00815 [Myxococcales bacterium]|nr:hypothetical protein [Myxococcales bacterium]